MGSTTAVRTVVRRESLADQAAAVLLDRIRSGEWPLGSRLPGETTLAPQLGVGRSTVREAIRQLAGRGVVQSRQGSGVFVAALDAVDDWSQVLQRTHIVAVLEARIAIESEAAAHAARRRTPAALRLIRRTLAERGREVATVEAHVDADTRFHRSVVTAAENPVLVELFDTFVPRVRHAMIEMLLLRSGFDTASDDLAHAELAEAIADRDPVRASELSRLHLEGLADRLR